MQLLRWTMGQFFVTIRCSIVKRGITVISWIKNKRNNDVRHPNVIESTHTLASAGKPEPELVRQFMRSARLALLYVAKGKHARKEKRNMELYT